MTMPDPPEHDWVTFAAPQSAEQPRSRAHRAGRAAAWVAVGAIGATAVTGIAVASTRTDGSGPSAAVPGVAAAASSSPEAPGGTDPRAPGMRMHMRGPGGGFGIGGLGLRDALHGEIVVKDGAATKTLLGQHGTVKAASDTSLTVESTDGFTATWTLNSSTRIHLFVVPKAGAKPTAPTAAKASDLNVGDDVVVLGTRTTSTSGVATSVDVPPTAAQIAELMKNRPQGGPGDGPGWKHDGPRPTTTATAPSSTA